MIRLASIFCVLMFANPVTAQQIQDNDVSVMTVDLICRKDTNEEMTKKLPQKFGEQTFAQGMVKLRSTSLNQFVEADVYMYVNSQDGSFTILSQVKGDNEVCILANGKDFVPWPTPAY